MAVLVGNQELDVDINEELDNHSIRFKKAKIRGEKLQACSPFRDEMHPSFAINLETGTWIDSGAETDRYSKGNLQSLLAYFEGITYEEVERYLIEKYSIVYTDVDTLELDIQLEDESLYKTFSKEEISPYMYKHNYLLKRGISEKVLRAFTVGYDRENKAVVFVWRDKDGTPINLKFRSVKNKIFYYADGGQPIKQHIYGLDKVHKLNRERVFVTESEVDALYFWSIGYPAIALGSASLSEKQEELIKNSPIEHLIIATDNDIAGIRCKNNIIKRLEGIINMYEFEIPSSMKDVNDMPVEMVKQSIKKINKVSFILDI